MVLHIANVPYNLIAEIRSGRLPCNNQQVACLFIVIFNRACYTVIQETIIQSQVALFGSFPGSARIVSPRTIKLVIGISKGIFGGTVTQAVLRQVIIIANAFLVTGFTILQT